MTFPLSIRRPHLRQQRPPAQPEPRGQHHAPVPARPQPDPLRQTTAIPALQLHAPERPRIFPVFLPARSRRRNPAVYAARVQSLMYPPAASETDRSTEYAEASRRWSRLTGTSSPLEHTVSWGGGRHAAGQPTPRITRMTDEARADNAAHAAEYDQAEARRRAEYDGDRHAYSAGRAA